MAETMQEQGAEAPTRVLDWYGTPLWSKLVREARQRYDHAFERDLYSPGASRPPLLPVELFIANLPLNQQRAAVDAERHYMQAVAEEAAGQSQAATVPLGTTALRDLEA